MGTKALRGKGGEPLDGMMLNCFNGAEVSILCEELSLFSLKC